MPLALASATDSSLSLSSELSSFAVATVVAGVDWGATVSSPDSEDSDDSLESEVSAAFVADSLTLTLAFPFVWAVAGLTLVSEASSDSESESDADCSSESDESPSSVLSSSSSSLLDSGVGSLTGALFDFLPFKAVAPTPFDLLSVFALEACQTLASLIRIH